MQKRSYSKLAYLTFSILVLCFAIVSLSSATWNTPSTLTYPPTTNAPPPLNISATDQYKAGGLGIGTTASLPSGVILNVNGTARMTGFQLGTSSTAGNILTAQSDGTGTWQPSSVLTGPGTANYIPIWTGATTQDKSVIYQTGGNIGINTTSPASGVKLDVNGTIKIRNGSGTAGQCLISDSTGLAHWGPCSVAVNGTNGTNGTNGISYTTPCSNTGDQGPAGPAGPEGAQGSPAPAVTQCYWGGYWGGGGYNHTFNIGARCTVKCDPSLNGFVRIVQCSGDGTWVIYNPIAYGQSYYHNPEFPNPTPGTCPPVVGGVAIGNCSY
ncbi:MAG: hypothetical protein NT155_01090 [Candidatus Staskawiczbacteria bacterium]|nr:hypothetical protein [Candidatus Staskawiczbacteria bacterium]